MGDDTKPVTVLIASAPLSPVTMAREYTAIAPGEFQAGPQNKYSRIETPRGWWLLKKNNQMHAALKNLPTDAT